MQVKKIFYHIKSIIGHIFQFSGNVMEASTSLESSWFCGELRDTGQDACGGVDMEETAERPSVFSNRQNERYVSVVILPDHHRFQVASSRNLVRTSNTEEVRILRQLGIDGSDVAVPFMDL